MKILNLNNNAYETWRKFILGAITTSFALMLPMAVLADNSERTMWGVDAQNTSFSQDEVIIGPTNVDTLQEKWVYETDVAGAANGVPGNGILEYISVVPAVQNGVLYFPDMGGRMHAVDAETGTPIWVKDITKDYVGIDNSTIIIPDDKVYAVSRTSPVIYQGILIIGLRNLAPTIGFTGSNLFNLPNTGSMEHVGADVVGIDMQTGDMVWKIRVDNTPTSRITTSMSIHDNIIYGAVSSENEEFTGPPEASTPFFSGASAFPFPPPMTLPPPIDPSPGANYSTIEEVYTRVAASGISNPDIAPLPVLPVTGYDCCRGVGTVFALELNADDPTQQPNVKWQTPMIDPALQQVGGGFGKGWSGASIWGSHPVIDVTRQQIFVGSSNLYQGPRDPSVSQDTDGTALEPFTVPGDLAKLEKNFKFKKVKLSDGKHVNNPNDVWSCLVLGDSGESRKVSNPLNCFPDGLMPTSIVALDMDTGAIKKSRSFGLRDFSYGSCAVKVFSLFPLGDTEQRRCQDPLSLLGAQVRFINNGFGQMPMLVNTDAGEFLIAVPKHEQIELSGVPSGFVQSKVFALDPSDIEASPVWTTAIAPAFAAMDIRFGSASDGKQIYVQATNLFSFPVLLKGESGVPKAGGYVSALNAADGTLNWQTRDPNAISSIANNATSAGRVIVANGVVYGTSYARSFFAYDAVSGDILFEKRDLGQVSPLGGSGFTGPAIVDGVVYWASGYDKDNTLGSGNRYFALSSSFPLPISPAYEFDGRDNKLFAFAPRKVGVCHLPDNNPAAAHIIEISTSALDAHLDNHPDDCLNTLTSGSCSCDDSD